ncbi:hypothetical protein PRZ48_009701 [Zasmidium cellare]|uniref:Uncharacterized protein n=1 Tax=Zasmidium cellare TaxID=395010 RepID=A0ABR0EDB9_ZASCE|nr:hypothetical protein PRZ48_009701 [Zasmidium cellare]
MVGSLGKLSAELRNRIYELVLVPAGGFHITTTFPGLGQLKQSRHRAQKDPLALIKTCRQARDEARKMFFALNTFRCFYNGGGPAGFDDASSVALDFVKNLGDDAAKELRNITLSSLDAGAHWERVRLMLPQLKNIAAKLHTLAPACTITAEIRLKGETEHPFLHIEMKHGQLSFDRFFEESYELLCNPSLPDYSFDLAELRESLQEYCGLIPERHEDCDPARNGRQQAHDENDESTAVQGTTERCMTDGPTETLQYKHQQALHPRTMKGDKEKEMQHEKGPEDQAAIERIPSTQAVKKHARERTTIKVIVARVLIWTTSRQ